MAMKKKPRATGKSAAKPRASRKKSNLERLEAGGVVDPKHLTAREAKLIEKMSASEVNALLRLRKKRGAASRHEVRPNIVV